MKKTSLPIKKWMKQATLTELKKFVADANVKIESKKKPVASKKKTKKPERLNPSTFEINQPLQEPDHGYPSDYQ